MNMMMVVDFNNTEMIAPSDLSKVTSGYYQREAQRELIDQAHASIKPPWEE